MSLETEIEAVRTGIRSGRFVNEAAVCQGIVLRLLSALSWPTFDTQIVCPEFSLGGRRVDFALCHPATKPIAFIEVKQVGQSDGGERQLFEYAFHEGIPLAILTDGREWHFFLPGGQGSYGERRVYKLDLVDREVAECSDRLQRYLLYSGIVSGASIEAAKEDYKDASRRREIERVLPEALTQLIAEEDGLLLEVVADKAESLCGFKPDPDTVAAFLGRWLKHRSSSPQPQPTGEGPATKVPPPFGTNAPPPAPGLPQPPPPLRVGYEIRGQFVSCRNAIEVLRRLFDDLGARDPSFLMRFAGLPKHGRSRRYLARNREELYPGRDDLCREYALQVGATWWMSTNHSRATIARIVEMAGDVAGLRRGQDFRYWLGE